MPDLRLPASAPAIAPDLTLSDFDYALPPELIAQTPAAERGASRMLHLDAAGSLHDRQFADLPTLLRAGDLLVFNDTRVLRARLKGRKASGGQVEVLVERVTGTDTALAHVRASKSPKAGSTLLLGSDESLQVTVQGREGALFQLRFPADVLDALAGHGSLPLPPYIERTPGADDDARYQTVYARHPGAVAAPTAGLHFDDAMLQRLSTLGISQAWVTLHVGAGTFQPVRAERLADHVMHAERWQITADTLAQVRTARAEGRRVVAVGTTSVRALESAAAQGALEAPDIPAEGCHGDTRLFITPGYRYRAVDALITNFHLPQSTLLMLVSALAGTDAIRRAYAHAVAARYRFFSYGDAMLIEPPTHS